MTHLYSCRHAGDQYRITKFDREMEVLSSYLCTHTECECPAGERASCRHRQMLPKFIRNEHVDTQWLYDYDRDGWVMSEIPSLVFTQEELDAVPFPDAECGTGGAKAQPPGESEAAVTPPSPVSHPAPTAGAFNRRGL